MHQQVPETWIPLAKLSPSVAERNEKNILAFKVGKDLFGRPLKRQHVSAVEMVPEATAGWVTAFSERETQQAEHKFLNYHYNNLYQ